MSERPTDGNPFLPAILADPEDDTVRLAYADWLDESADAKVPCDSCNGTGHPRPSTRDMLPIQQTVGGDGRPRYVAAVPPFDWREPKCEKCDGAGMTPDPAAAGRRERAEFIRVQIELAKRPPSGAIVSWDVLLQRERELLDAHRRDWFAIDGLQRPWSNAKDDVVWATGGGSGGSIYFGGKVTRGFVSAVACTLTAWCGGPCACRRVMGGFLLANPNCESCHGKGATPGHGPAIVRAHPVTRVVLSDKRQWEDEDNAALAPDRRSYGWWDETPNRIDTDGPNDPGNIPTEVFRLMWRDNPANRRSDESGRWLVWDEPDIAPDELSRALLALARSAPIPVALPLATGK